MTSGQWAFEDEKAAAHKRQMEADDAAHQRQLEFDRLAHERATEMGELRQQTIGRSVAMLVVVAIALACVWILVSNRYPVATVDKAAAGLLLIAGGMVGYITGQATKK